MKLVRCEACQSGLGTALEATGQKWGFDILSLITVLMPILMDLLGQCGKQSTQEQVMKAIQQGGLIAKFQVRRAVKQANQEGNLKIAAGAIGDISDAVIQWAKSEPDLEDALEEINNAETDFSSVWS